MTLEEEKKLVAEKLMGWEIRTPKGCSYPLIFGRKKKKGPFCCDMFAHEWNPHQDRNCWPELFDKIHEDENFEGRFLVKLLTELKLQGQDVVDRYQIYVWSILTAPPEICWKALIKTLQEAKI